MKINLILILLALFVSCSNEQPNTVKANAENGMISESNQIILPENSIGQV